MHIITGIGKHNLAVVKKRSLKYSLLCCLAFASCGTKHSNETETALRPRSPVQVTHVSYGSVSDNLNLFASTYYLKRNTLIAPIPAFITAVNIKLGDRVNKGDVLYALESKERRALGNHSGISDSIVQGYGKIFVKASASGIISTLDKQQTGDYIPEGTQLCTIAESSDLAFQINVPYEFIAYAKTGQHCTVILPDGSRHQAVITTTLSSMNAASQTETILAKPTENLYLPENLIVKILIGKDKGQTRQLLPRASVLSDEMMKEFWVMKMINDSTAIKVPVKTGNKNTDEIEIISPIFLTTDQILTGGNYGLPDTASVIITNK